MRKLKLKVNKQLNSFRAERKGTPESNSNPHDTTERARESIGKGTWKKKTA